MSGRGSPRSCGRRRSAGRSSSARRSWRWCGRTRRGATPTRRCAMRAWGRRRCIWTSRWARGRPTGCSRSSSSSPGSSSSGSSSRATCARRAGPRCRSRLRSGAWPLRLSSTWRSTRPPPTATPPVGRPAATDIAFALAVLAVIGSHLPAALRTFLLTLAVVDDLLAITIIAVFFTDDLHVGLLVLALVPIAAFGVLVQRRVRSWWLLVPLAVIAWVLVHESGVHPTVAGVLLALTVPVPRLAEHFEHRLRPLSAGFAVPVFALLAAGVAIGGLSGLGDALGDPVALGVVAGLVLGKVIGITAAAAAVARLTRAHLDESLSWLDVLGVALLGGVGFTVSLLIGELAFGAGSERNEHVKVAVLTGSLTAAALAAVVLRARERVYRRMASG